MTGIRHFTASAIVLDDHNRVLLVHHNKDDKLILEADRRAVDPGTTRRLIQAHPREPPPKSPDGDVENPWLAPSPR